MKLKLTERRQNKNKNKNKTTTNPQPKTFPPANTWVYSRKMDKSNACCIYLK